MASVLRRPEFEQVVAEAATDLLASRPGGSWPRGSFEGWRCETVGVRNIWHPPVWALPNVWVGTLCRVPEVGGRPDPAAPSHAGGGTVCLVRAVAIPVDLWRWLPIASRGDGWESVKAEAAHGETRPCIDWVIVGGESGSRGVLEDGAEVPRPMELVWVRSLLEQCREAGVRAIRQTARRRVGAWPPRRMDASLFAPTPTAANWEAWPEDLRVREFPAASGI
jgi:hypothetical protein